jgi:hypothetical protein
MKLKIFFLNFIINKTILTSESVNRALRLFSECSVNQKSINLIGCGGRI